MNNIYREPFPFSCWLHSEKPTMVKCLTLSSPGDRVLPLHGLSSPCVPAIRRCPRLLPTTTSTSLHIAWDLLADFNATNTKLHNYHVHPVWHEICKAVVRLRFRACITCGQPHWTWTLKALRLSATWGWPSPVSTAWDQQRRIILLNLHREPAVEHYIPIHFPFYMCEGQVWRSKAVSCRKENQKNSKKQKGSVYSSSEFRPVAAPALLLCLCACIPAPYLATAAEAGSHNNSLSVSSWV